MKVIIEDHKLLLLEEVMAELKTLGTTDFSFQVKTHIEELDHEGRIDLDDLNLLEWDCGDYTMYIYVYVYEDISFQVVEVKIK